MEPVELTDGVVRLRALRADDLADVVVAARDPEAQRWTTIPSPYGEADARFFVLDYSTQRWAEDGGGLWAVCTPADARYAGAMEVRRDPADPEMADVGFVAAPWARGRGYTTRALRLACAWAFASLGVVRIEWRAYVGNDGSRRVAEKAGFRYEGLQRARLVQRGERRDCWVAALLPGDAAIQDLAPAPVTDRLTAG